MKDFLICMVIGFICLLSFFMGLTFSKYSEKNALEIKVLQYELKAYEEMDKELKE